MLTQIISKRVIWKFNWSYMKAVSMLLSLLKFDVLFCYSLTNTEELLIK